MRDDEPRPVWMSLLITHNATSPDCVCLLLQDLVQILKYANQVISHFTMGNLLHSLGPKIRTKWAINLRASLNI
jgi:hypothetical protein